MMPATGGLEFGIHAPPEGKDFDTMKTTLPNSGETELRPLHCHRSFHEYGQPGRFAESSVGKLVDLGWIGCGDEPH